MDPGGKERLHQFAELQLLLGLRLHPDRCWSPCDSDRDNRMLCHYEGDEESVDCGKLSQTHNLSEASFFYIHLFYFTPPGSKTNERHFLYTHTTRSVSNGLKVNPWQPSVLSSCIQRCSLCQTGMTVKYNRQSHAECVFKSLDLECSSCQRNEGHHRRLLGLKSV